MEKCIPRVTRCIWTALFPVIPSQSLDSTVERYPDRIRWCFGRFTDQSQQIGAIATADWCVRWMAFMLVIDFFSCNERNGRISFPRSSLSKQMNAERVIGGRMRLQLGRAKCTFLKFPLSMIAARLFGYNLPQPVRLSGFRSRRVRAIRDFFKL
jgi:hypothetical protein